jgi:hypothetical protein
VAVALLPLAAAPVVAAHRPVVVPSGADRAHRGAARVVAAPWPPAEDPAGPLEGVRARPAVAPWAAVRARLEADPWAAVRARLEADPWAEDPVPPEVACIN